MPPKRSRCDRLRPTSKLGTTTIDLMIPQHVTNTRVTYEVNKNNTLEKSGVGSSTYASNNNVPQAHIYKEFMKYQPRSFYENEGVIRLTIWIENMELIFLISSYAKKCRVKFATCTFMDASIAWWKKYIKTMGIESAYGTTWEMLGTKLSMYDFVNGLTFVDPLACMWQSSLVT